MPLLGAILTSAPDLAWLRHMAAGLDALKVVTAWGLPWTDTLRYEAARLCPVLVVRTVSGDPSYQGGAYALPDANLIIRELEPWYHVAAGRDLMFEIGNEPVIGPPDGEATLSEHDLWAYTSLLTQSIARCAERFPLARFILPAQMVNHPVRVGPNADGAAWHAETIRQAIGGLHAQMAAGIHAYTQAQYTKAAGLAPAGMELWLTEFAANRAMDPVERGELYREAMELFRPHAGFAYHLDYYGGENNIHFNPNYQLERATIEAFIAPSEGPPEIEQPEPEPPPEVEAPMDTVLTIHPSVHYSSRGTTAILAAVVHATAGSNSLDWLTENPNGVSAHALITKAGSIYRMVRDDQAAHHVGNSVIRLHGDYYDKMSSPNNNQITLGVEIENLNTGTDPYPAEQILAAGWLLADWLWKYPDMDMLKHRDIDTAGKTDPNGLSWRRIVSAMAPWLLIPRAGMYRVVAPTWIYEAPDAYAPIAWGGSAHLPVGAVDEFGPLSSGPTTWLHYPPAGFVPRIALEYA